MGNNDRGAYSELQALSWLISQGYHTFRNQCASGPIDMIAVDPESGEAIYIDVKTLSPDVIGPYTKNGYRVTKKQWELGVKLLGVTFEGECFWFNAKPPLDYRRK